MGSFQARLAALQSEFQEFGKQMKPKPNIERSSDSETARTTHVNGSNQATKLSRAERDEEYQSGLFAGMAVTILVGLVIWIFRAMWDL